MGKKRKHSAPTQTGPREVDPKEAKLGPIRTYEDVADSEDEFHINRDKVLLDEGPGAKRRRKYDEDGNCSSSPEITVG
jgi:U3 small nucleolar RNA-associated protein 3